MKRRNYDGSNFGYTPQEMERLRSMFLQGNESIWDDIFVKTNKDFLQDVKAKKIPDYDAQDIVQEVWCKFYKQLINGFKRYDNMRSWFGQVLHNTCMDYFNQRNTDDIGSEDTPDDSEEDAAESEQERSEAAQIYIKIIDQLDPACQQILKLRVFDELAHAQIGEIIGEREGTARKKYHRCMECLRTKVAALANQTLFVTKNSFKSCPKLKE